MFPMPQAEGFDPLSDMGLPGLFEEPTSLSMVDIGGDEGPIVLFGMDLQRFQFRLDNALSNAKGQMTWIHNEAKHDRRIYRSMERVQEYEGQPNITTPISANKTDGLLAHVVDAIEQRPLGSFVPEGIGKPAERASQVAPLASAYLEREINRGGSRERLVRDLSKEAVQVGTGIGKLAMVRHPGGEWFVQVADTIPIEQFYVDRIAVGNLKHVFCAYEDRRPFYQLEEMADGGLIDREALEVIRNARATQYTRSQPEEEAGFFEQQHAFQEEVAVHTIYWCYMRFRAMGDTRAELYEAIWHDDFKKILAVRKNPAREAFDHPPICLHRIGKNPKSLFGVGVVRRLTPIQNMADNAINAHLALNTLAASPPFLYKMNSPFGRLMHNQRRIVPGIGIPTIDSPDRGDVAMLDIRNPGLSLQDISVAQAFADRATYTEEAIGTTSDRKTLGQFRVEMQRGTMRVRLDLGDLAYDASTTLTMMWAMMVAYKVKPAGVVEVEEGGRFLGIREIDEQEIEETMDSIVLPMWSQGEVAPEELMELEGEFNSRLTDGIIPSARRSDLTIQLTGTKIIADKATELDMLHQLTPYILQGLELAEVNTYWNHHLRSIIEAMGFKDVDRRVPSDPGPQGVGQNAQLAQPLAETLARSSSMF